MNILTGHKSSATYRLNLISMCLMSVRVGSTYMTSVAHARIQAPAFMHKIPGLAPATPFHLNHEIASTHIAACHISIYADCSINIKGVSPDTSIHISAQGNHPPDAQDPVITYHTQDGLLTILVQPGSYHLTDCTIWLPRHLDVQLVAQQATTTIDHMQGALNVRQTKGDIVCKLPEHGPDMSIYAHLQKGSITLAVHPQFSAHIYAQTRKGSITSDIPLTIGPLSGCLSPSWWKEQQRSIKGMIGKGGIPITLQVDQGKIRITGLSS